MEKNPLDYIMDGAQIADELGFSKENVRQLLHTGELPQPIGKLAGGNVWLRADIEAYAARSRRDKTPQPE